MLSRIQGLILSVLVQNVVCGFESDIRNEFESSQPMAVDSVLKVSLKFISFSLHNCSYAEIV